MRVSVSEKCAFEQLLKLLHESYTVDELETIKTCRDRIKKQPVGEM